MIQPIDRRSDKPPYKQLADQIRALIESGHYPPGSPLPPEPELGQAAGLNRTTVRNAIRVLRNEGRVDVIQGRGTFVRAHRLIRRYPLEGLRREYRLVGQALPAPHKDLWSAVTDTSTNIEVSREYERMQAPPHVAEAFGAAGQPLAVLCRRHLYVVDGRVHQASWSYLRWDLVDGTPAVDPSDERPDRGTMAQLADLGVRLTHAELVVWSRQPNPDEARLLDVPEGGTVLAQRRIMYAADEVVEVADVIVPGDRTELAFRVDLAS